MNLNLCVYDDYMYVAMVSVVIRGQPWVLVVAFCLVCARLAGQRAFAYPPISASLMTTAALG